MFFFFFKQKTAYELRISDWSSDVCSSDLGRPFRIDHPKIDHRADADGDIVARDHVLCGHVEHHCPQIHADHLLDIGDEKDEAGALDGGEAAEGEYDAALIFAQNLDRRCQEQKNEDERRNVEGQKIGRAHVCTPVTNAHLVCRLLLATKYYFILFLYI